MPITHLDFISSDLAPGAAEAILTPLLRELAADYAAPRINVTRRTAASYAQHLSAPQRSLPDAHPALIVLAAGQDQLAAEIADHLASSLAAAVLLLPDAEMHQPWATSSGLVVAPHSASPARIAAMLHALSERQSTVRTMAGELLVAARASGGLRGEMDRLHEELNLASLVQREYMPKCMPDIDGMDFGVIFRPTGYVSGDIYQVRLLDDRHVSILLADAVGHGVPAALLTMIVTNSLSPMDEDGNVRQPADVLTRLNARLCLSQQSMSRFATAVYGVLDIRTHQFTIAGAGHPPPLIMGDGTCEKIETEGPLLGVFAEAEFTQVCVQLRRGQTALLYTDGFEVACPGSGAAGHGSIRKPTNNYMDRFQQLLAGHELSAQPASSLTARLAEMLDEQAGSLHQIDDITALAIAPVLDAVEVVEAISRAA